MTVVANDFVPVNAYTTHYLYLGVGARYDVTIDASQPVGNYWLNVTLSKTRACGTSNNPHPAAILRYAGAQDINPTDPGIQPPDTFCADQTDFVPIVSRKAPREKFAGIGEQSLAVTLAVDAAASKVFWKVNNSAIDVVWEKPTLEFIRQDNTSYPAASNVLTIPDNSEVGYGHLGRYCLLLWVLTHFTVELLACSESIAHPSSYSLTRRTPSPSRFQEGKHLMLTKNRATISSS